MINGVLFQKCFTCAVANQYGGREYLRKAHITVNQVSMALENITNPFEIDGLVLRLDYLMRTFVNQGIPRTDEIIQQLG